ncbi:MAG: hypothetical protein ABII06_02600 [Pseudomonadota bacterium]
MNLEKLKHGVFRIIELVKPGDGRPKEHDAGLIQQGVTEFPCIVRRDLLPQQYIDIFHNEQEASLSFICKIHQLG